MPRVQCRGRLPIQHLGRQKDRDTKLLRREIQGLGQMDNGAYNAHVEYVIEALEH